MPDPARPGRSPRGLALRFVGLFLVYVVAGNILLSLNVVEQRLVLPWTRANAAAAARAASLTGVDTTADGVRLESGAARLSVLQGCNGVHALLIFVAAVLAFPAGWRARAWGLAGGTVAIFGINLVRLVNLVVVARYYPARLELFHVYVWQTLIVLLAFVLFLTWGGFVTRERTVTHIPR